MVSPTFHHSNVRSFHVLGEDYDHSTSIGRENTQGDYAVFSLRVLPGSLPHF